MRVREISGMAIDAAGELWVVGRDGGLGRLDGDHLESDTAPPCDARIVAIAPRPGGGLFAADALSNCLRFVTRGGEWGLYAGAPQPPSLDARPRRADGTASEAYFRAPSLLATAGDRLFCAEAAAVAIRTIADGSVSTIELPASPLGAITSAAAAPDGTLYLADGVTPIPCLVRLVRDGRVERVAGDPDVAGADDGTGPAARFARIGALAATDGGCFVADGSRVRFVAAGGEVTTIAGAEPGFRDGPGRVARFGAIAAMVVAADGAVVVADPDNGALRRVDPSGDVSTIARDSVARAFGDAIVDGETTSAWAIAESLVAEHSRRGTTRPDRGLHPVSVASARVGREMALEWCASDDPSRARLGAYCLWLIRSEEGFAAPASDAERLVGAVGEALESGDLSRVLKAVDVVRLAFGDLARRRDRLAVAEAYRNTDAARHVSNLFAAADRPVRRIASGIVEQARDIRFTPSLAALALDGDEAAAHALRAIWGAPAFSSDQAAELRSALRFGRGVVERLLAERGDDALGRRGTERYRGVVAG